MDGIHEAKGEMLILREGGNDYKSEFCEWGQMGPITKQSLVEIKIWAPEKGTWWEINGQYRLKVNNALNFCVFAPMACL